jgi:hypothetical protein
MIFKLKVKMANKYFLRASKVVEASFYFSLLIGILVNSIRGIPAEMPVALDSIIKFVLL